MFKTCKTSNNPLQFRLSRLLSLAVLLSISVICSAAEYYVSTTGNDTAGNGSIGSPWRTISKGQSMLSPSDTLYVRGGTYYESVTISVQGTPGNPITLKAYPGESPVLDGRSIITGWTKCAANEPGLTVAGKTNVNAASIYKTTIDTSGLTTSELWRMLYEDDTHSFLCRWPEQSQGYGLDPEEFQDVPTEAVGSTNGLLDNTVLNPATTGGIWYPYIKNLTAAQLAAYWNGSYVQIWFKSGSNSTASYSITGYAGNEIATGAFKRGLLAGDKYCFYRHPHLVNNPGKFYFAPAVGNTQTCYFWPRNAANLTSKVTLATKAKGIYASNKDYIVIDGLKVVGFEDVGIHFINSTSANPVVKNCIVEDCGNSGIYLQNTTDAVVDSCTVNRVGDRGIFINGGSNCAIKNSTARDNRGTCISMYTVEKGQITNNTIYDARGVHVNGVSCYMGCNKILIAKNKFDPGVNLALQNISDVCIFANIMDGGGQKTNLLSTWVDTTNSNHATDGYQVYLNNTFINSSSPYTMIDFNTGSGSFAGATIDNNGGKVRLNAAGRFTSSQFKYTGRYGLMVYCDFSDGTYADGWYESIANTADTCTIDLAYVSNKPTAAGKCGGRSSNYLYNNLIGGCAEWESNIAGRSHNWWIPKTYGSTYATPNPPLAGEMYTYYSDRTSALNSCFTDWANQNYTLKTGSAAISAGMSQTAINAILNDTTIGANGTSIRQNFPDFDFMTDIAGKPWAAAPSMGAYEYASGGSTPTYTLTTTAVNGTVTKSPDKATYTAGEVVTLTAAANPGYVFTGWNGDASGTSASITVTMNSNKSVTATFVAANGTYTLTTTAANGTVTKSPDKAAYTYGETVTLTAVSAAGYTFSGWSGDASGATNPLTITMNGNKAVTALFTQTSSDFIIDNRNTTTTVSTGIWSVSGGANPYSSDSVYARNPNLSFSWLFSPTETGYYEVDMWWTEFSSRSTAAPVEIQYASGTTSVTVNQLTNGGKWNALGQYSFNAGATYRVTIRTLTDNSSISADAVRFVKMQNNSSTYTLSVTATNGAVTKSPDKAAYAYGETVTLAAAPAVGYSFANWSGIATGTINPVVITMDANKSVTANFDPLPTAADIRTGLVGEWMFSEYTGTDVFDSSGYGSIATLQNGPEWGCGWAQEDVVMFSGTNQAVQIDFTAMRPQAGTVAMLVESESSDGLQFLFGHILNNTNYISLYTVTGKLALGLGNNLTIADNIAVLEPRVMYHIALTWDQTTYAVYVDGQQKTAGLFSGLTALASTADAANRGTPESRDQNFGLDGILDDVQIFNRSLSAKEIVALSNTLQAKENHLLAFCVSDKRQDGNDIYVAMNLPAGAAFDTTTQTLTWSPWYNQAGDYQIIFTPNGLGEPLNVIVSVQNVTLRDWYREFLVQTGKI